MLSSYHVRVENYSLATTEAIPSNHLYLVLTKLTFDCLIPVVELVGNAK